MTDTTTLYDRLRVQLPLEPGRHGRVYDWLAPVAARPSFARGEAVQPG